MSNTKHEIALITDSTCDIPQEMRKKYDIHVVPLYVIWGEEELRDEEDITVEAFYKRLPEDPVHPTTSQPTPKDFVNLFEKVQENGTKEAVVIAISDKLSGTLDSVRQAADMVDLPVQAFDSRSVSMGLGWQVIAAARAREAGADAEGMLTAAERTRDATMVMFTVDTLDYLHKGGRIGAAAKLLGTALKLKPQLIIDPKEGIVEPGERVRTRSKAIDSVYNGFFERLDTDKPLHITVMHINAQDDAEALVKRIEQDFDVAEIFITATSPVIGVHGGPGTVGLVGYSGE